MAEVYADQNPILWSRRDLDITNRHDALQKIIELKPDLVINCTAYNAVDKAEDEPMLANAVNGEAVGFLAEACKSAHAVLVHYSTNYVFDGNKKEGYNEGDTPSPQSVYGRSKLLGEQKAQQYDKAYVIRTAWLYGQQGLGESSKRNFVNTMLDLTKEKERIECVDDQFGNPTYAKDVAQATRALVDERKPYGIYHFVNDGRATWFTWAKEIFQLKNINVDLIPTTSANNVLPLHKAKRPQYGILNNTKFIQLRPWEEALREYLS